MAAAAFVVGFGSLLGWCAAPHLSQTKPDPSALARGEARLRRAPVHSAEFSPVVEPALFSRCGVSHPPEALVTPDPLLQLAEPTVPVRVSFIVGTDGHVYSPFILDSGGPKEDQIVLRAVGRWRYRPALCNGVPTDFEARVQFRIR